MYDTVVNLFTFCTTKCVVFNIIHIIVAIFCYFLETIPTKLCTIVTLIMHYIDLCSWLLINIVIIISTDIFLLLYIIFRILSIHTFPFELTTFLIIFLNIITPMYFIFTSTAPSTIIISITIAINISIIIDISITVNVCITLFFDDTTTLHKC